MRDLPFLEASAILSAPHICPEMQDWWYDRNQPNLARCATGLVAQNGSRSGLFVELTFVDPPRTKLTEFKFTVFQTQLASRQRVYQMHLNAVARAPKNWHDFAHEHFGDRRFQGSAEWLGWSFPQALDYFCQRTNIRFEPPVRDPSIFELQS